jgi:D-3-phosphoglycerate dehydrogenase / 2-oxoglutarate reductase
VTPEERRVLISTVPFGQVDPESLALLAAAGAECVVNPKGRRLKEDELVELIPDFAALIAGTEPITDRVMAAGRRLKLIARVGIGLDNVDLEAARRRGIVVTYTPDAPAPAVSELTIGLMLSLLRSIPQSDRAIRRGEWTRFTGRRLEHEVVGIIGMGRIGQRVVRHLAGFGARVIANDIEPDHAFARQFGVEMCSKEAIYRDADIISLHVPLTAQTRGLVGAKELASMKPGAFVINTARGHMIDEQALAEALRGRRLAGAALDVFAHEPYGGDLRALDNCLLTSHIGSMSVDCRVRMEVEAAREVARFFAGQAPLQPAPLE